MTRHLGRALGETGEGQYLALLEDIMLNGEDRDDRTGVGTRSLFGRQLRFNLRRGFPLLTTKRVHFKSVAIELLWFLKGTGDIRFLQNNGVTIWDEWADEHNNLGPTYGVNWRKWPGLGHSLDIDQLEEAIDTIRTNPKSRRIVVSAWNPSTVEDTALPPCHVLYQFYVTNDGRLSCHMYQRSADAFLGVPFNIASYALLTHMVAHVCNLDVGELIISFGDVHIYKNHFTQVETQLSRNTKPWPDLVIHGELDDLDFFTYDNLSVMNYDPHPAIPAPVAV